MTKKLKRSNIHFAGFKPICFLERVYRKIIISKECSFYSWSDDKRCLNGSIIITFYVRYSTPSQNCEKSGT